MTSLTPKYKPYPAYSPSNVEWLGEIPAHWKTSAVKNKFSIKLGKMLQNSPNGAEDVEVPYLKAVNVQWFRVQTSEPSTMWANQKEIELFGIQKGDLLVCEGGEGGRCGIVEEDVDGYIIQNALHRVRPLKGSRNDFLEYVLSTVSASGWFDALNERATIAHFTGEKFSALRMPFPPLPEQRAIAGFLDRETARIDELVAKKERLIALLQEKRTALITRSVTRGLEPNALMKDSGVEWLGEIPAHWEVRRLKSSVQSWQNGIWGSEPTGSNDIVCVRVADFDRVKFRASIDNPTLRSVEPDALRKRKLLPGDLLLEVSGGGEKQPVGAVVLYDNKQPSVCSNFVAQLHPSEGFDPRFLTYLHAALYSTRVNVRSIKQSIGIQNLDKASYLNEAAGFPPVSEQHAIAEFLNRETAKLDALVAKVQDAIDRLAELRVVLISAAVTGRVDVREEGK